MDRPSRRKMSCPPMYFRKHRFSVVAPPPTTATAMASLTVPGESNSNSTSGGTPPSPGRRRFSNVGEVVSRKLSTTIGWRITVPVQDIVDQSKCLCSQYIRAKLKRSGVFNKKLGLQRLRSTANIPGGYVVGEVFHELQLVGVELERMHPHLFASVCRHVCTPATSDKVARGVLASVAGELFKNDVSWGKIVSLFAVAGGLAVDCVKQGHPEYLFQLVDGLGGVVETHLATWIHTQGGWPALSAHYKQPDIEPSVLQTFILVVGVFIVVVVFLILLLKMIGKVALKGFGAD